MARAFSRLVVPLGVLVLSCAAAQGDEIDPSAVRPVGPRAVVTRAAHHDLSPPLFLIPPVPEAPPRADYEPKRLPRPRPGRPQTDRALQAPLPAALAPVLVDNLDGVGNGFTGPAGTFTVNSAPPDTNGDVGPNHYVQLVNTDFAIFNKVGTPVFGPVRINTLWSGFGGDCQTNNDGDPIVLYDPIADRWILSQFSVSGANGTTRPFLQCVAVSQTPDPTGAYYRYSFSYTGFNDYPKFGVWPDGYYVSFNMFNAAGTSFLGAKVCAYNRARMLLGQSATQQCFDTSTSFGGLLPADLDGARLPPAGAPNPVVALGASINQLAVWKFHADWTTPANSTLSGPTVLATAAFTEACGASGTCIPQSGGGALDSLGDRLMFRLAYRRFADSHQSLVVNHSVTAGTSVGVRWYELRLDSSFNPSLFQQGTYAPDASYRWMGSIAQDQAGNMALGFSVASSSLKPQIRYTGRLAGDPAGQMTQGEGTLIAGAGAQGSSLSRWGDYSMMAVDPSDDCTFWYTQEYIPANGTFNWRTRIGSFSFPGCGTTAANDFSIAASPGTLSLGPNGTGTSTVSTAVVSGTAQTVTLSVAGVPTGASASLSPASVTAGASSTLTVNAGTAAAGTYTLVVTGTSASASHSTSVVLTVTPAPNFSLAISPSSRTVAPGGSTTFTVTTTAIGGSTQSIALSVAGLPSGVTGSFSPATVTAGGSSTLTTTAAASAPAATATFTVTGTSGTTSHAASASLTVSSAGGTVVLSNGVPLSSLSGGSGSQTFFVLTVPAGQASLVFTISGGTGDADLYVRFGALPTTSTYNCRPYLNGNNESCSFTNPAAGAWYVMLRGFTAYSGVTLKGIYAGDATPSLTNGVPVTGISGAAGSQKFWKLSVPSGKTSLAFTITGSTGDADLYVRFGALPTTTTYNCRPYTSTSTETCSFANPTAGNWYVMIRGYTAYSGVTLKGQYP